MKRLVILLAFAGCSPAYAQESQSPHQFFLEQQVNQPVPKSARNMHGGKGSYGDRGPTKSVVAGAPKSAYVRGRLTCAMNVNKALAAIGVQGTGTAKALDFLRWGRASGKVPGAVQVSRRKGKGNGHVEIVASDGMCWNPSSSQQRWVLVPCDARRNVVGWRVA